MAPPGVLPADLSAEELSELLPPGAGEGKLTAGDTTSRQVREDRATAELYGYGV